MPKITTEQTKRVECPVRLPRWLMDELDKSRELYGFKTRTDMIEHAVIDTFRLKQPKQ